MSLQLRIKAARTIAISAMVSAVVWPAAGASAEQLASLRQAPPLTQKMDVAPIESAITAVDLTYQIYGGGMHVVSFGTQAVLTPRSYEIASQFQTEGVADNLFNGRMSSQANGLLTPEGPRLLAYSQDYNGRFGERSISMSMDNGGGYSVTAVPEDGIHAQGFSPTAVKGTVDPLTASIFTAINSGAAPCDQVIPVFDGRRIFHLEFADLGTSELSPQGAGTYEGAAWKCAVTYKPVAGFTRKFLVEQARDPMKPFTVWLARFDDTMGPNGDKPIVLPVRMLLETPFVNATAHLTTATVDGRHLIAALSE